MADNTTANLKALAQASSTQAQTLDEKIAKAKAKARLEREIGPKASIFKASLKLFAHVFIITAALLTTDWIFNNGLQTQLLYRGAAPNKFVSVMKNKAYHINSFVKSNFSF